MRTARVLIAPSNSNLQNLPVNAFDISENLDRRITQYVNALGAKPRVTDAIARGPIAACMGFAIDFDREPRRCTIEIEHIVTSRVLPAKAQSCRVAAQCKPHRDFGGCHLLAQPLCVSAAGL